MFAKKLLSSSSFPWVFSYDAFAMVGFRDLFFISLDGLHCFFSPPGVFHPNSLCIMAQSFILFQLDSVHILHHAHFLVEGFYSAYVAGFWSLREAFFIWFWVMKSLQEVEI